MKLLHVCTLARSDPPPSSKVLVLIYVPTTAAARERPTHSAARQNKYLRPRPLRLRICTGTSDERIIIAALLLFYPTSRARRRAHATRPACHWFEESCQNTAAATTQVHPAPCQSRPSKVKVVERQKQRRTGSDRPAPSAALLCRASSLAPLYQNPRVRRGTGMDACPMWPNQSAHPRRPPIAMQRRAPDHLSAFAACQLQTSSCGAFTFKGLGGFVVHSFVSYRINFEMR